MGTATAQLDTSVNIAFPAITRGFDLTIGDIQWVVICYVLTYASLLLVLGRIGDTIGPATVYRAGLIWSAVALLLVSCAPSYGAMLVFRCLQGVGAALVMSCGAALVTSLYGEERRGRALGIYTMMMASGWMLGPLLGTVTAASLVLMVFEVQQTKHGFFEAFHQTFQLAALLAFVTAGLLALSSRRIGKPSAGS